jgi:hypothetical protein
MSGLRFQRGGPYLEPHGRAIAAHVLQQVVQGGTDEALAIADSAGVFAAVLRRGAEHADPPFLYLDESFEQELLPPANALTNLLTEAEAYGRAIADVWILLPADSTISGERHKGARAIHISREITIPVDDSDVRELALQWHRELKRTVGIEAYEGEPPSGAG